MLKRAQTDYRDPQMSLQYLADEYKTTPAYLGRIFKKETGSSFNDFLTGIRIEKACALLRRTDLRGTELSGMLGFSSYNYFYMVFRKKMGMNPMEYREHTL